MNVCKQYAGFRHPYRDVLVVVELCRRDSMLCLCLYNDCYGLAGPVYGHLLWQLCHPDKWLCKHGQMGPYYGHIKSMMLALLK